jgi:hypothetical protein
MGWSSRESEGKDCGKQCCVCPAMGSSDSFYGSCLFIKWLRLAFCASFAFFTQSRSLLKPRLQTGRQEGRSEHTCSGSEVSERPTAANHSRSLTISLVIIATNVKSHNRCPLSGPSPSSFLQSLRRTGWLFSFRLPPFPFPDARPGIEALVLQVPEPLLY